MTRSPRLLLLFVLVACLGALGATVLRASLATPAVAGPVPAVAPASALATTGALPPMVGGQPLPSLAPMLENVTPAVVSVQTRQRVPVRNPFLDDPFFRRMFPHVPRERIEQSLGSGVIVDATRGLVLTNHHVIEGADEVTVTLHDGRVLEAEFVGSDPDTDVAVMKIPAGDLHAIPLADSSSLRVGDFVVAVGNPFGIGQTVTSGIVSAVGRSGLRGLGYQDFIQTDASINPGNSGGALVSLDGRLVGINTASFNPRGSMAGNIGLGFAIPANLARSVMDQLVATGEVRRGTLGIETQDLDARLAQALGLEHVRGTVVTRVHANSAGARAGLRAGDVITAANGNPIHDRDALRNFEGLQAIGSEVVLDLHRDGRALQVTATLLPQPGAIAGAELDPRLAGATFAELPERLRQAGLSGVLVEAVEADSRAARSGLRAGDVVTASSAGNFGDLGGFRTGFTQAPAQLVLQIVRGNRQGVLPMQ